MRYIAGAAVLVLAGCAAPAVPAGQSATAADAAPPVACSAQFRAGQPVHVADHVRCKDATGHLVTLPTYTCRDGSHLGMLDVSTGAPAGWFISPGRYVVPSGWTGDDPRFKAAFAACLR